MNVLTAKPIPHYYGNIVRTIFIIAGVAMLAGLPQVTQVLRMPGSIVVLVIVILGIAAGIVNPVQPRPMVINIFISFLGLIFFSYIGWFINRNDIGRVLLVINQIVAVLFLFALYLSVKTYRGYVLRDREIKPGISHE